MIVLNIFFIFLILIIFSDLYINNSPKSRLVLVPLDYKFRNKDNNSEVVIDLKIINKSKNKYECSRAILVGHNAHFDSSFLSAAYKRNNIKKTPFHKFSLIDTVSLGVLATGQTVLARICDALNIDYDNDEAHSAAYDTIVTAKVFCSIVNKFDI